MLFKNTLAQSSGLISGYILAFVLAPIMLSRLGLAQFGVWAFTGAVATYVALADLGITRSMSRFVALYDAEGRERGIREVVGLGIVAVLVVGAVSTVAAILAAPLLSRLIGVLDEREMRTVLLCSSAILTFQAMRKVFASVPQGLRRMVPPNVATVVANFINFAFSIGALALSRDLVPYALANAAAELLGMVCVFASMVYVWRPRIALPPRARVREILTFGVKNQVVAVTDLVNYQTDKVIIALLVDVRAAAVYEIAARVVFAVRFVGIMTISAMIPTVTAFIVERGRAVIPDFYRHYTRRSVAIAFPIFVLTAASAPFLFTAWLGEIPGEADVILVFLMLAAFFHMTTGVASSVATGEGRAGMVAANSIVMAVANVALTAVLAPLFGLWGVLSGTLVAISVVSLLFIVRFHQTYSVPRSYFLRAVAAPAALSAALAAPLGLWSIVGGDTASSRPAAVLTLAAMAGLYGLVYWVAASRLELLPARLTFPWLRRREPEPAATAS